MGSVEDADGAAAGDGPVRAPQEIVGQLLFAGTAERRHGDADRANFLEHVPDGAILAGGVDALQDDEKSPLSLGVQPILQPVDGHSVVDTLGLGGFALRKDGDVGRIALAEVGPATRLDAKVRGKTFCHEGTISDRNGPEIRTPDVASAKTKGGDGPLFHRVERGRVSG